MQSQGLAKRLLVVVAAVAVGFVALITLGIILIFHVRPAPTTNHRADALATLGSKIEALQAEPPKNGRILRVTEPELNALVDSRLAASRVARQQRALASANASASQAEVTDVRLKLVGDRVNVYVGLKLPGGKQMSVDIEGTVRTVNGSIDFVPTAGSIGAIPLPHYVLEEILKEIDNTPGHHEAMRLPDGLASMQVQDGELLLAYK